MLEFYVYDNYFKLKGIIDVYVDSDFDLRYDAHSLLTIKIDATLDITELLLNLDPDERRIITKVTDIETGYMLNKIRYEDEEKKRLSIDCISLSAILRDRLVDGQQAYEGNVEEVIRSFVTANAIEPTNPNRVIPDLILGPISGIDITTDEAFFKEPLDEVLWKICKKFDISYRIKMDHINKKYIMTVFQGLDRSSIQNVNSRVIFSKDFDNVTFQSYTDDPSTYRNMIYVDSGGSTDSEKTTIKVGDELSGWGRREMHLEASDITKKYQNDKGVEVTMTTEEFEKVLRERGLNTLAEYPIVRTFESDIDPKSQFIYGKHYNLGDIVTNINDEIGVMTHSRVVRVREKYSEDGYEVSHEFGTSIPTLIDKIKREVKK